MSFSFLFGRITPCSFALKHETLHNYWGSPRHLQLCFVTCTHPQCIEYSHTGPISKKVPSVCFLHIALSLSFISLKIRMCKIHVLLYCRGGRVDLYKAGENGKMGIMATWWTLIFGEVNNFFYIVCIPRYSIELVLQHYNLEKILYFRKKIIIVFCYLLVPRMWRLSNCFIVRMNFSRSVDRAEFQI